MSSNKVHVRNSAIKSLHLIQNLSSQSCHWTLWRMSSPATFLTIFSQICCNHASRLGKLSSPCGHILNWRRVRNNCIIRSGKTNSAQIAITGFLWLCKKIEINFNFLHPNMPANNYGTKGFFLLTFLDNPFPLFLIANKVIQFATLIGFALPWMFHYIHHNNPKNRLQWIQEVIGFGKKRSCQTWGKLTSNNKTDKFFTSNNASAVNVPWFVRSPYWFSFPPRMHQCFQRWSLSTSNS